MYVGDTASLAFPYFPPHVLIVAVFLPVLVHTRLVLYAAMNKGRV